MEGRFRAIAEHYVHFYESLVLIPFFFNNGAIEFGVNDAGCQHLAKIIYDQGGRYDVLFFDFGFSITCCHICDLRIQRCRINADGCELGIHILSTLLCLLEFF